MIVLLALYVGSRYGSLALGAISGTGLAASACSYKRGLDLGKDPAFQARLKDPDMYEYMYGSTATSLGKEISASAKRAVYIFLASIAVIVLFASCQRLLPSYEDGSRLKMNIVIQIVMLTAAALMVIVSKASPKKAVAVSVLINSQSAVVVAMLPLAYSLGIPGPVLLGVLPSVYGYFFIPNYPSDIATVNFDRSGTTVIRKYLLNHSFMMPGLVSVAVSTIVASIISGLNLFNESAGGAVLRLTDLIRATGRDNTATFGTTSWTHVDDVVGVADDIQIVLDDYDGGSVIDKALEHFQ